MVALFRSFWWLVGLLALLNLGVMVADTTFLSERRLEGFFLLPQPRVAGAGQRAFPQERLPLRLPGLQPTDLGRLWPGIRPPSGAPRPQPPVAWGRPALRPFGLHQVGGSGLALHLVSLLGLLAASVALTYFIPHRFRVMREALGGSWADKIRLGAIGLMGYLLAAIFAFLLTVGLTGIPLALLAVLLLLVLTMVGVTAVSLALGRWLASLARSPAPPLAQLLLGVLVIFPATILPYVGWVAAAVIASFGLGAILLTRMGSSRPWSLDALRE